MIEEVNACSRPQLITLSSFWSAEIAKHVDKFARDPVYVITSGVEAAIRSHIHLVGFRSVPLILFYVCILLECGALFCFKS